jgi:hypothetical protein
VQQIAVALYIQKCYEPSQKDELAVPQWMEQALLSDENLARFSNSLVATARAYPRRHVVWTQILQVLFPTDCTTVKNPTVSYSKDGNSCIKSLFCAIVEPHLVTSTYECRAFALDLLHDVSRALPTNQLQDFFLFWVILHLSSYQKVELGTRIAESKKRLRMTMCQIFL